MKILVVGGAGYIGSHMVKVLHRDGHEVTTLDNLSNGYRDAVLQGEFIEGDTADHSLLARLFANRRFDAVMHFASFIEVGDSVANPGKYYDNNVGNTLNLLNAMLDAGIKRFVFSSTAAIFGDPERLPIQEDHRKLPINPYGRSKLMVEQILSDMDKANGLKSVCLRYFNAAGADSEGELGERHVPETHLIPLILQAASGKRDGISIFGTDYDTPDGTCIRDYIHVEDLCSAHSLALNFLLNGGESNAYNLGNGQGFSVREVIDAAKQVTKVDFRVNENARRPGDPARLIADSTKIQRELGWRPKYGNLETIIRHAWEWEHRQSAIS